jgi:hypothetical protein
LISGDFDALARLWQQEPSDEEMRLFAKLARRASSRARTVQIAETLIGGLLIVAVISYLIWKAAPAASLFIAAAIVVGTVWTSWRRHVLAKIARLVESSNREVMLRNAATSLSASLKRSRLGLTLLIPGFVLGAMLKYCTMTGGLDGFLAAEMATWRHPRGQTSHVLVLLVFLYLGSVHFRLRGERDRLERLWEQYRDEARLDGE